MTWGFWFPAALRQIENCNQKSQVIGQLYFYLYHIGIDLTVSVDIWHFSFKFLITKTYLYNFDPLKPHFYIVKLGFTGVYIIFLISAQNIDCWYSLEPPRRGCSNRCPQSMFWAVIWKISEFFYLKIFSFWRCSIYLNRRVFVNRSRRSPDKVIFFRSPDKVIFFLYSLLVAHCPIYPKHCNILAPYHTYPKSWKTKIQNFAFGNNKHTQERKPETPFY